MKQFYIDKVNSFKGFKPFKYQENAYVDCMEFLLHSNLKNGLCIMPTGAGKSLLVAWLSLTLYEKGIETLMVVPSIELLEQNKRKIEIMGGQVGVFSGKTKETDKPLTIATLQSLNKNADVLAEKYKYIIIDEAHYKYPYDKSGLFYKFLHKTKHTKLLGLTASPFSLEQVAMQPVLRMLNTKKKTFFRDIIHLTQIQDVVAEYMWSKLEYKTAPFVRDGLILNKTGNDFTPESVEAALKAQNVNNNAYLHTLKIVKENSNPKILLFVESLETADTMKVALEKKLDKRFEIISSKTKDKERANNIDTFVNTNEITGLINVGTLTTGFDCPDLTHILIVRPTNSLTLYYQMIGRLVRKAKGKHFGTVIDFCGNIDFFGTVENIRISYINGIGWCATNGNILLTNVNIASGKKATVEEALKQEPIKDVRSKLKMPSGKYKDEYAFKVPVFYQEWFIDTYESQMYLPDGFDDLLDFFIALKENREKRILI